MRFRAITLFVAAALVVAAPAYAQRQSLADRVAMLEQKAADPQANLDLLNQANQLRTQVQELQGTVEQLQHDNEQLKQQIKDQYLDLDGRLNRLEGGATPAAPVGDDSTASAAAPAAAAAGSAAAPIAAPAASVDERSAYAAAFDALKAGHYDQSSELFQAFLQQYPQGQYAPNALYWLGESYYATHNFPLAEAQFQDLVNRFPEHDKASGGLLKLGMSQYGEGRVQEAEQTLKQVVQRYPQSDSARLAKDRLQSIQLGQQLH